MKKSGKSLPREGQEIKFARDRMESYAERIESYSDGSLNPDNPIARAVEYDIDDEIMTVHAKNQRGERYNESKDVVFDRAEIVARKSMEIAARTNSDRLALKSAALYMTMNPDNLVGSGGVAHWVNGNLKSIYDAIAKKDSGRAREFRSGIEKLMNAARHEDEDREFRKKGYSPNRLHTSTATAAACIAGVFAGFALFAGGISGNTIDGLSQTSSNGVGIVLLILGLIGMIWASRDSKK